MDQGLARLSVFNIGKKMAIPSRGRPFSKVTEIFQYSIDTGGIEILGF
jgi:hypothetical protein